MACCHNFGAQDVKKIFIKCIGIWQTATAGSVSWRVRACVPLNVFRNLHVLIISSKIFNFQKCISIWHIVASGSVSRRRQVCVALYVLRNLHILIIRSKFFNFQESFRDLAYCCLWERLFAAAGVRLFICFTKFARFHHNSENGKFFENVSVSGNLVPLGASLSGGRCAPLFMFGQICTFSS